MAAADPGRIVEVELPTLAERKMLKEAQRRSTAEALRCLAEARRVLGQEASGSGGASRSGASEAGPSTPSEQPPLDASGAAGAAAAPPAALVCAAPGCGATADLRRCGACNSVRYCSAACARTNWKAHRPACKRLAAELDTLNTAGRAQLEQQFRGLAQGEMPPGCAP